MIDKRERTIVTITPLPNAIRQRMEETGKNYMYLRYDAKVCSSTLSVALRGENVSIEFAETLAKELGTEVKKLFVINKRTVKYAYESNHKIKRTLRVILATAKKQRLIADNYASADFINFPKRPQREIDYMNDDDAKRFYAAAEACSWPCRSCADEHHNRYLQSLSEELRQDSCEDTRKHIRAG